MKNMEVIERKLKEIKKNMVNGFLIRIALVLALVILVMNAMAYTTNVAVVVILGLIVGYILATVVMGTYLNKIDVELRKLEHIVYVQINHVGKEIPEKREVELDIEDNHIPHVD